MDFMRKNRDWQGWVVCGGLIHTHLPTRTGALLLCVQVIGLGGAGREESDITQPSETLLLKSARGRGEKKKKDSQHFARLI